MKKLICFSIICLLMSCEDMVEQLPKYDLVSGNTIIDQASAEAALNGSYSYFTTDDYYTHWHGAFDQGYVGMVGYGTGLLSGRAKWWTHGFMRDFKFEDNVYRTTDELERLINVTSGIINNANVVLEQVPKLDNSLFDENRKAEILGEAHFLRAFGHLHLFRHLGYTWDINSKYGGICRTESTNVSNRFWPRSTVKESYQQILFDLTATIEANIPFRSVYNASSLAAKMYKTEVLLMRGEEGDYQEALNLTNEILSTSERRLEENYIDIFINQYNSCELIFTRANDDEYTKECMKDQSGGYNLYSIFGPSSQVIPSDFFYELCDIDKRCDTIIQSRTYGLKEKDCFINHYDEDDGDSPVYFCRFAQAYLMKAEALLRLNGAASGSDIFDIIDILRERSGNEPIERPVELHDDIISDILFLEIIKELNIETDFVWSCFSRFKYAGKPMFYRYRNDKLEDRSLDYILWNIPLKEMQQNPNMIQNPAYQHLK